MTTSDLRELLGGAGPWMASLVITLFMGVALVAFAQGRSISIWPLKIGPRTRARSSAGRGTGGTGLVRIEKNAPVDRHYDVAHARDFYQEIAASYDLRNSGNLVSTHLATVAKLQEIRAGRPTLRVLDLGGGTGKLIAVHFFNDDQVWWTYVDSCPAMAAEFRRNLAGYPLGCNSEIVVDDLARTVRQLRRGSYDVVVLSLVLSSMPALPDLAPIARLLSPGGALIVTDIGPGYTRDNPLYKVSVGGKVLAFRTSPVDPFEIIRRAHAAGLQISGQETFGEGETYYSFMTIFVPVVAVPAGESEESRAGAQSLTARPALLHRRRPAQEAPDTGLEV